MNLLWPLMPYVVGMTGLLLALLVHDLRNRASSGMREVEKEPVNAGYRKRIKIRLNGQEWRPIRSSGGCNVRRLKLRRS